MHVTKGRRVGNNIPSCPKGGKIMAYPKLYVEYVERLKEEIKNLTRDLEALSNYVTWSRCPKCNVPVQNGLICLNCGCDPSIFEEDKRALRIAAEEAYQNEVIDTGMKEHIIGPGMEYFSKEDWIESKIIGWLKD